MKIFRLITLMFFAVFSFGCVRFATIQGCVTAPEDPGATAGFREISAQEQGALLQEGRGLKRARLRMSWEEAEGTSDKIIFTDEEGVFKTDILITGLYSKALSIGASHPLHMDPVEAVVTLSPLAPWKKTVRLNFSLPVEPAEEVVADETATELDQGFIEETRK